jgi:WD40 repeat protein/energy-coupling factor transporter ATP-binding protein EcfA2
MTSNPLQSEEARYVPQDEDIVLINSAQNPFPGLRPFTVDECHLFFGREGQVDDILVKLSKNRFVCVMGYSGSGKSSLMYCGLVPVLYGGFVTHSGPHWHVIISRPGTNPIQNLADSIVSYLISEGRINREDEQIHRSIIGSVLRSGPHGLIEITRYLQTQKLENVFFMIDQFEELFRVREGRTEAEAFDDSQAYVNLLLNAIKQQETPVYCAITMRSDFISRCSIYPGLTKIINESNYLVPQMNREQKKMVIEGPIAVGGGKISQRLVKKLLNDIGKNQDQLPILQHSLLRTWDYWVQNHEHGEPMDIRHYNAIGKVTQALSQHANEAYDELSARDKEIAEILFKSVTEKSQDNRGMRRPCKLSLLADLADASEEEVKQVVEHFRKPGRSLLMPAHSVPLTSDSVVELSHESLMRIWNRLSVWVEEEFESAQMYKRLSSAAAMYQIGRTGLWRPPDLQLALNWQKKQRPSREWAQRYDEAFERAIVFLDTSRITYEAELKNQEMLQRRMLRRARATAVILGIAAVIAILFFLFAYLKKIEADAQTILANQKSIEAERQRNDANQQRIKAEYAQKKAEEARQETEIANQNLQNTLKELTRQRNIALAALDRAEQQEKIAIEASIQERAAKEIAVQQTAKAQENYELANRLLMLTKAQALAAKSVQEDDDYQLSGLQAMQAFLFHRRYEGKAFDPYIYSGLYHALTLLNGSSYNAIKVKGPARNSMNSVVVSSKSTTYYAAAADGRIIKGDYENLTNEATGISNPHPNKVVALSKDENYLVNGTDSATVQIFDLAKSAKRPLEVNELKGSTNAIEFLPDNSGFVISKSDKSISVVNHLTGKITPIVLTEFELKSLSISPDGQWLVGGAWTGQLVLVNLRSKEVRVLVTETDAQILSTKFSPDGKTIAYGTYEIRDKRGLVKMYDFVNRKKSDRQFSGHKAGVFDVEFSPDGKLLASAGADSKVQMWVLDFPEDLPIVMDNNNGIIRDIQFANGSNYLIAACRETEIRVWPTNPDFLAKKVCPKLKRNMTLDEWSKYVGNDIKYETTCVDVLINDF